jgi:hypothetical protein
MKFGFVILKPETVPVSTNRLSPAVLPSKVGEISGSAVVYVLEIET